MDQVKKYKWIQDRLHELNAGTIAENDFRELEVLAQDDPFVADALEGFQLHPGLDHTSYLKNLKERIKPVQRERRRWLIPNLTVTAVAASLILIVGFWAVMNKLSTDKKNEVAGAETNHEVQITSEPVADSAYAVQSSPAETPTEQTMASAEAKKSDVVVPPPPTTASREKRKQPVASGDDVRNEVATKGTIKMEDPAVAMTAPAEKETTTEYAEDAAVPAGNAMEKTDLAAYANQINPAMMAQRVTGRVLSTDGIPLTGANVMIKGTNLGTVSGEEGKFELFLPAKEALVEVTSSGYDDIAVNMKQGEQDLDILLPYASVGDDSQAMGRAGATKSTQAASPKMSTVRIEMNENLLFVDYLKTNSKYPLAETYNGLVKKVTLSFLVDADGHPSQIKIAASSGSKSHDDEAVRLIRKGPDWICGHGYPCQVMYSIYFRQ